MNHGVWGGVIASAAEGKILTIESWDATNICPMTSDYPLANPLPAGSVGLKSLEAGSVFGVGVNLHNNLWNTNCKHFFLFSFIFITFFFFF